MSYKSGWNPYQPFYPKDAFSKTMLSSIITKVSKWLENMNEDTTGEYGELQWNYTPDGGTIIYANESKERFIQIWWDVQIKYDDNAEETLEHGGDPSGGFTVNICGSDKRFENVTNNLEFFTAVEHSIYSELEQLQREINESSGPGRFLKTEIPAQGNVKVGPIQSIGMNGITYDESSE
jgi:hypothetical protein